VTTRYVSFLHYSLIIGQFILKFLTQSKVRTYVRILVIALLIRESDS